MNYCFKSCALDHPTLANTSRAHPSLRLVFLPTADIFGYCSIITVILFPVCAVKRSAPRPTRCSMGGGMLRSSCPASSVLFRSGSLPFVVRFNSNKILFFLYFVYLMLCYDPLIVLINVALIQGWFLDLFSQCTCRSVQPQEVSQRQSVQLSPCVQEPWRCFLSR